MMYSTILNTIEDFIMTKKPVKAVRDKIPEMMESGKEYVVPVNDQLFLLYMENKLNEEVEEYKASRSLEEFIDILTVMKRIQHIHGWNDGEVEYAMNKKLESHGGFSKNYVWLKA